MIWRPTAMLALYLVSLIVVGTIIWLLAVLGIIIIAGWCAAVAIAEHSDHHHHHHHHGH